MKGDDSDEQAVSMTACKSMAADGDWLAAGKDPKQCGSHQQ